MCRTCNCKTCSFRLEIVIAISFETRTKLSTSFLKSCRCFYDIKITRRLSTSAFFYLIFSRTHSLPSHLPFQPLPWEFAFAGRRGISRTFTLVSAFGFPDWPTSQSSRRSSPTKRSECTNLAPVAPELHNLRGRFQGRDGKRRCEKLFGRWCRNRCDRWVCFKEVGP